MAGSWFVPRVVNVSRGKGDAPATAKAAYRAGALIRDERTGDLHDYRRKGGIETTFILAPAEADPALTGDRAALWNHAEATDKRKNSVTARELVLPLPADVSEAARREIAEGAGRFLVERYGVAADVAIHAPHPDGDGRNHHAHILFTTRRLGPDGLAEKIRILDDKRTGSAEYEAMRKACADETNRILEHEGVPYRVDHRSYERRGMEREPTQHMGPAATAMERQGEETRIGNRNRAIEQRNRERRKRRQEQAAGARDTFRRAAQPPPESRPLKIEGQQVPAPIPASHVPARTRRREQARFEVWANGLRARTQSRQLDEKGGQGRAHTDQQRDLNQRLSREYGPQHKTERAELAAIRERQQRGGWWYRLTRAAADRERAAELRANLADRAQRVREERGRLAVRHQADKHDLAQRHERERRADEQRIENARARREADGWKPLPPREAEPEKERGDTSHGNGDSLPVSERVQRRRQERRQRGDRTGPDRDREP